MAISINWVTGVIFVPKADLPLVQSTPFELRRHDISQFHFDLRDLADDYGRWPITHIHNTNVVISGISYARQVIINPYYTVEYEDGQYGVILENANNNVADVKVFNQVSLISNNSGGLVGSEEISNQSYINGNVFINTLLGSPTGLGTPTDPVPDFSAAFAVADIRKLIGYDLAGTINLDNTSNIIGKRFFSPTPVSSGLILNNVNAGMTYFARLQITGPFSISQSTQCSLDQCFLGNVDNFFGSANETIFTGDINVNPNATGLLFYGSCKSGVGGDQRMNYNCNGANAEFIFRDYQGGIKISNFTQGKMSIDGNAMRVEIDSSCTGGEIVIGGTYRLYDNSNGTTVIESGINTTLQKELAQRLGLDPNVTVNITKNQITFGNVVIDISGDGENTSVYTRTA